MTLSVYVCEESMCEFGTDRNKHEDRTVHQWRTIEHAGLMGQPEILPPRRAFLSPPVSFLHICGMGGGKQVLQWYCKSSVLFHPKKTKPSSAVHVISHGSVHNTMFMEQFVSMWKICLSLESKKFDREAWKRDVPLPSNLCRLSLIEMNKHS